MIHYLYLLNRLFGYYIRTLGWLSWLLPRMRYINCGSGSVLKEIHMARFGSVSAVEHNSFMHFAWPHYLFFGFQSTASIVPQLWQPTNGILMTNDTNDSNPEESTACIALSKNDSYVMSASGGKVSLFNMMTFKVKFPNLNFYLEIHWCASCLCSYTKAVNFHRLWQLSCHPRQQRPFWHFTPKIITLSP